MGEDIDGCYSAVVLLRTTQPGRLFSSRGSTLYADVRPMFMTSSHYRKEKKAIQKITANLPQGKD